MASNYVSVDATDCIYELSVTVKVTGVWRLKLGILLLKAAGVVLGCPVHVHSDPAGI